MATAIAAGRLREGLRMAAGWQETATAQELQEGALADLHPLLRADATGWNDLDAASGPLRIAAVPADAPFLTEQGSCRSGSRNTL